MLNVSFPDKTTKGEVDCTPPEYIMPETKAEFPLLELHPTSKEDHVPDCIKVLTYSGWNPPPPTRKMHGELWKMSEIHKNGGFIFGAS